VNRALYIASRLALGAVFLYAAATKVPDMAAFAQDFANFRLVPPGLVPYGASAVVGIEVVLGLALASGFGARPAALATVGMLFVFLGALAQALLRGIDLKCGCFGGDELANWWTVARDALLLAPAALVLRLEPRLGRGTAKRG
jgi:putative oxidoreductase